MKEKKQRRKQLLVLLLLSGSACNSFASEFTASDLGTKYLIMAGPQAWRLGQGSGYPDPNDGASSGKWVGFNQAVARGINSKVDELKLRFGIINGDITEFGRDAQLKSYYEAYGDVLKLPLYLGYGNHDYENNVLDCTRPGKLDFSTNACAFYMLQHLEDLTAKYSSRLKNFDMDYAKRNSNKSMASFSYSWDDFSPASGTSHFVQLQLAPTHTDYIQHFGYAYTINDSLAWLRHDLALARKRGVRNIFLNFHGLEYVKEATAWQKAALKAMLEEYKISAVFVGHTHEPQKEYYKEVFGEVPIYTTGALYSGYFDILNVKWDSFQVQSYQVKNHKVKLVENHDPVNMPKAPPACLKPGDNVQPGDIVKSKLIQSDREVFILKQYQTSRALDSNANGEVYTNKSQTNNPYMRWRIEHLSTNAYGQDFYRVIHNKDKRILDGDGDGEIYTKWWNAGPYQQWEILKYDDGGLIQLRNRATHRLLDANAGGEAYGTRSTLSHGNNYQKWELTDLNGNSISNVRYFKAKSESSGDKPLPAGETSNAYWEYISARSRVSAAPCVEQSIDDGFSQSFEVPVVNGIDLSDELLSDALQQTDSVVISTWDGNWSPNMHFPTPGKFKGKAIFIKHNASYSSTIDVNDSVTTVRKGQRLVYVSDGMHWEMHDIG
ncbi:metallophosphoesterase [Mixta hanseatica]|uniref:Metallophosphoesterase n=1 Tax=Mixta hanseatica TaxID=2872648 RepID=A0ABY4R8Y4_9GAMM|nr:metallophosphoesterase [Mixta hanseatica]UQY43195.1 metallophosphoesterase [Mixta hanseatica]